MPKKEAHPMPIYEFKCPTCGRTFDLMRKSDDRDAPAPCPDDKTEAQRLVSKTTFELKGGGWAKDGYGN